MFFGHWEKKTPQVLLLGFFVVSLFLLANRLSENAAGSVIKSCMQTGMAFFFFLS